MSALTAGTPVAALRRAALLVGLVAVIAGFLGMHILTPSHGLHGQAAPAGLIQTSAEPHAAGQASSEQTTGHSAGHSSRGAAGIFPQAHGSPTAVQAAPEVTPAAATVGGSQVPPSCACQGGCAETPSVHIGCTPSPAGASLSAPQPGTTPAQAPPWSAERADHRSGYAYLPGTPTPRDLSISRT